MLCQQAHAHAEYCHLIVTYPTVKYGQQYHFLHIFMLDNDLPATHSLIKFLFMSTYLFCPLNAVKFRIYPSLEYDILHLVLKGRDSPGK